MRFVDAAECGAGFRLRLRVTKGAGGDEILPTLWSDNYVSLVPGEKRELTARLPTAALGGARPVVVVTGWNLPVTTSVPESSIQSQRKNGKADGLRGGSRSG